MKERKKKEPRLCQEANPAQVQENKAFHFPHCECIFSPFNGNLNQLIGFSQKALKKQKKTQRGENRAESHRCGCKGP